MQYKKKETISAIENFINAYVDSHGIPPTITDISKGTGISKSTVGYYLLAMAEDGLIEYDNHHKAVTKQMRRDLDDLSRSSQVPIVGSITCGSPQDSEQFIEDNIRLPKSIFGPGPLFILHARGESMIEANIFDGDLVVVRQQQTAEPGEIVVALTENGTTLKKYYPEPENQRIRLQPANSAMEPMYYSDVTIQGVAVKIIKNVVV